MAKIPISGGIAGLFFAVASMAIFLLGIPVLRFLFPAAIALGCGVALVLHFVLHERQITSFILPQTKK
jgi:hypothetical protein